MELRESIIDAAIELLSQRGYSKFSALQVARKLNISQSHLTHYFPTREDLLNDMATEITKRYVEKVEQWLNVAIPNQELKLKEFVDYAIDDAVSEPTRTLFPALWEAANNNEKMAVALEQIYDLAQASFLRMFNVDPEHPSSQELWRLVRMLGVIIEGSTALYGRDLSPPERVQDLKATVYDIMMPQFFDAIKRYRRQVS